MEWTTMVMALYRNLLRQGRNLKLTDKDYYRRMIRQEFDRQKDEVEVTKIQEQYEVLCCLFCSRWLTICKSLRYFETVYSRPVRQGLKVRSPTNVFGSDFVAGWGKGTWRQLKLMWMSQIANVCLSDRQLLKVRSPTSVNQIANVLKCAYSHLAQDPLVGPSCDKGLGGVLRVCFFFRWEEVWRVRGIFCVNQIMAKIFNVQLGLASWKICMTHSRLFTCVCLQKGMYFLKIKLGGLKWGTANWISLNMWVI